MVNYGAGANGIVPDTVTRILAGLYIARPPTTSFSAINLAANVLAHPLPNCRLYYSQVTVDPQKSIDYVQRNRNKKVIYRSFVTNSYNNIISGSSFNALVNFGIVYIMSDNYEFLKRGIVHPTAVLICPFIGAVNNSGFGDSQIEITF